MTQAEIRAEILAAGVNLDIWPIQQMSGLEVTWPLKLSKTILTIILAETKVL